MSQLQPRVQEPTADICRKRKGMGNINKTIGSLEHAQVCWVIPDIHVSVEFFSNTLGIAGFPKPQHVNAADLKMTYHGKVVAGEWLTTQSYNGGTYLELVQPLSGESMFHDYLAKHPLGGVQHHAFRLSVEGFEKVTRDLRGQGYQVISEVNHPFARMAFFDTYHTLGVVTEIMGITEEGWKIFEPIERAMSGQGNSK